MSTDVSCSELEQQLKVLANEHHLELEIWGQYKLVTGPCFRDDGFAWEYKEGRDEIRDSARQSKALVEANFPVRQWVYVDEAPFDTKPKPTVPEIKFDFDARPLLDVLCGLAVIAASAFVAIVVMAFFILKVVSINS